MHEKSSKYDGNLDLERASADIYVPESTNGKDANRTDAKSMLY